MYIKNKIISIIFKLIIVIGGIYGLSLHFGIFEGRFDISVLNYFTVLSNIVCVIYFIGDIIYLCKGKIIEGDIGDSHKNGWTKNTATTWFPVLKGVAMMSITVTFLVSHFILKNSFTFSTNHGIASFLLHYLVPIMTIFDWLLFDKKGIMKKIYPFLWVLAPLVYFGYAMIAARIGNGIGGSRSRYPYDFIDVDRHGITQVLITVVVLVIFFIILGYVYYGLDRLCSKIHKA